MNKAIFFDRDGTILVEMGYVSHPLLAVPYRTAGEALRLANQAGFLVVVVSNQSGIARGWLTEYDLSLVHRQVEHLLACRGARIDAFYYCPHHPEGTVKPYRRSCRCRKPAPGLGLAALERFAIDPHRSFMIGDKYTDMEFGRAVGLRTCMVRTGYGAVEAAVAGSPRLCVDHLAPDVLAAVHWVLRRKDVDE